MSASTLLERVRVSDQVAWSGYGEARGDLVLPDLSAFEDLPDLISGTTRLRAWWRGPADYRVDALGLTGEADLVVSGGRTWTWESEERRATLSTGDVDVRLPRAADLVAPALGARLSRSTDVQVEARPARRVGGGRRGRAAPASAATRRRRPSSGSTCGSSPAPASRCGSRCTPGRSGRPP